MCCFDKKEAIGYFENVITIVDLEECKSMQSLNLNKDLSLSIFAILSYYFSSEPS